MDDDGLERLRGRQDQPPAEHDSTLPRGAPPAAPRIAERDRDRPDIKRRRVIGDGRVDREAGLLPEPRLQDAIDPLTIAPRQRDLQLEARRRHDPGNRRASRRGRRDPQPMELAAIADGCPVGQPAASGELGTFAGEPIQVPADPTLAIAEERIDPRLGVGPTAARRRRDADDESEVRIDRDPEMPRPGRVAKDVVEGRAQRERPSRNVATAFSIRRWRVSSVFAPITGSTQKRCML